MDRTRVHLAACMLDGSEPLGLEYVAAALAESGFETRVHAFRDPAGFERAARRIASSAPPLVGLSIPSGHAALHVAAFANRLRALGYGGHVTAGGPFATLCTDRLLESVPAIDSVVRHDGEDTIAALVREVILGGGPCSVPGVSTREGSGPDEESGEAFSSILPKRSAIKQYAGAPTAKIAATRGCNHSCRYCGLSALHRRRATRRIRRRSVEHVAEEMARLYHEEGVRFFHFVDENPLPDDEAEALVFIRGLDDQLGRRGVGRRALSMMLRADAASDRVVPALARLGVARSLLGVESMSEQSLRALGRGASSDVNVPAMDRMARSRILFHFNVLLIHPDSTLERIARDVSALHGTRGGLLDPFQVEAFEGTRLFDDLERSGRLEGGPFVWHYELEDPRAEAFARLFSQIKSRVMGDVPLTTFAYDVLSSFAVAGRLGRIVRRYTALENEASDLVERHNRLWLGLLESALELASSTREARERFLGESARKAARLTLSFEAFKGRVESACTEPLTCDFALPRSAAAVALALSILGPGCSRTSIVGATDARTEEVASDPTPEDPAEEGCTFDETLLEHRTIIARAHDAGCTHPCDIEESSYRFVLDEEGHVIDVEMSSGTPLPEALRQCYIDAVADQVFPCLAEAEFPVWEDCFVPLL
jgi:methylmalonyl-CoA mutase cobalamin-binding subunit